MKLLHRFRWWLAGALALALIVTPIAVYATGQVITGTVTTNAAFVESVSSGVINPYQIPANIVGSLTYTNGTASNQVDTLYAVSLSLASTTQTIDLTSLTDPAGVSINFARVREIWVVNTSTSAGFTLNVQAGASNGFTTALPLAANTLKVPYSGALRLSDPVSTGASTGFYVDSTHKTITFDSGAHTVTFYVLLVGGSAA